MRIIICFFILKLLFAPHVGSEPITVAVVFDGPGWYFDHLSELVEEEAQALSSRPVRFVFEDRFNAQWDTERFEDVLEAALSDPEVDVVFAAGVMVAQIAADADRTLPKPVLAGYLQDPSMIDIPLTESGASAKPNFAFVVSHERIRRDLAELHQLFRPQRVDVLMDEALVSGMRELEEHREELGEAIGAELNLIAVRGDPGEALDKVPGDASVVYVTPMLRMDDAARGVLYEGLNRREIRTFALLGLMDVRVGALAGLTSVDQPRLARRMALNLLAMGEGRSPSELPVDLAVTEQLFLNERVMRMVGYRPSVGVLLRARFVETGEEEDAGIPLSLSEAISRARENHIRLVKADAAVEGAEAERRLARGALGPQLGLEGSYRQIDQDRAAASLGLQPRSRLAGGAVLRQWIYNDGVLSRARASGSMERRRAFEVDEARLDVTAHVSERFFDALSARALLRVERDQLNRIRDLLALARLRVEVGQTPPEDAMRWEAEEAARMASLLVAEARSRAAIAALNQAMGMPVESDWRLQAVELADTETYFLDERLGFATGSMQVIRALTGFWSDFALENAPALAALDEAIEAGELLSASKGRSRFVPEIGLQARVEHVADRRTAGPDLGAGLADAGLPIPLEDPPENEWSVAVVAEIPLFDSGTRRADRDRARAEVRELRAVREEARQHIELGVSDRYATLMASQPGIRLSRIRAEKARESLDLVQERYQSGTADIVEVLDAQGRAFAAEQAAVIAVNQYLKDLTRFQRAISWFAWLASDEAKEGLVQQLKSYLESRP